MPVSFRGENLCVFGHSQFYKDPKFHLLLSFSLELSALMKMLQKGIKTVVVVKGGEGVVLCWEGRELFSACIGTMSDRKT